jgi:hypothetical protein
MPNHAQSFETLPELVLLNILDELMPRGHEALDPSAYKAINEMGLTCKRIQALIDDPHKLWRAQLRRIVDALGLEELPEEIYFEGFAHNPKQLAQNIIRFNYKKAVKNLYALPFFRGIRPQLSSSQTNPILSHLNCIKEVDIMLSSYQPMSASNVVFLDVWGKILSDNAQHLNNAFPSLALLFLFKKKYDFFGQDECDSYFKTKEEQYEVFKQLSISFLVHWPNAKKLQQLMLAEPSLSRSLGHQGERLARWMVKSQNFKEDMEGLQKVASEIHSNGIISSADISKINIILNGYWPTFVKTTQLTQNNKQDLNAARGAMERKCDHLPAWQVLHKRSWLIERTIITTPNLMALPDYKLHVLANAPIEVLKQEVLKEFLNKKTTLASRRQTSYGVLNSAFLTSYFNEETTCQQIMDLFKSENENFIKAVMRNYTPEERKSLFEGGMESAKQTIELAQQIEREVPRVGSSSTSSTSPERYYPVGNFNGRPNFFPSASPAVGIKRSSVENANPQPAKMARFDSNNNNAISAIDAIYEKTHARIMLAKQAKAAGEEIEEYFHLEIAYKAMREDFPASKENVWEEFENANNTEEIYEKFKLAEQTKVVGDHANTYHYLIQLYNIMGNYLQKMSPRSTSMHFNS